MKEINYGKIVSLFAQHKSGGQTTDKALGYPIVLQECNIQRDQVVLDFGCGPGTFAPMLRELGATVVNVDKSAEMMRQAQENNPIDNCLVYKHGLLQLVGSKVDAVTVNFVLCTVFDNQEVKSILQDIYNVLRPGGRLVILEPNWERGNGVDFRTERRNYKNNLQVGDNVQVTLKGSEELTLNDVYRPQVIYRTILEDVGFHVEKVLEPLAPASWGKEWEAEKHHPAYVIYVTTKK